MIGSNRAIQGYVLAPLHRGFSEVKELHALLPEKAWIAGGYGLYCATVRAEPRIPGDIDVFCENRDAFLATQDMLLNKLGFVKDENEGEVEGTKTLSFLPLDSSMKWRVNVVESMTPIPDSSDNPLIGLKGILDGFDFTISRVGILNDHTVLVDEDFAKDDLENNLRIKYVHCPLSVMMRCIKYGKQGYVNRPREIMKILSSWEEKDFELKEKQKTLLYVREQLENAGEIKKFIV